MAGHYHTLDVPADLAPMVDSVWRQVSAAEPTAPPTSVLPALYGNLIINRGDDYLHAPPEPLTIPRVSVHGIRTRPIGAVATGRTDLIVFNVRPWVLAALMGLPAAELTDQVLDLETSWERQIPALVEGPVLPAVTWVFDRLRAVVEASVERPGLAGVTGKLARYPVARAAAELGLTRRHLQRVMNGHMGVSPKRFQQLLRYQGALASLRLGEPGVQVAAAHGYVDQSHLIHEIERFTGRTPDAFRVTAATGLQQAFNRSSANGLYHHVYA